MRWNLVVRSSWGEEWFANLLILDPGSDFRCGNSDSLQSEINTSNFVVLNRSESASSHGEAWYCCPFRFRRRSVWLLRGGNFQLCDYPARWSMLSRLDTPSYCYSSLLSDIVSDQRRRNKANSTQALNHIAYTISIS